MEKFTFFWQYKSPFSQWYQVTFFSPDGFTYNSMEQYMMHRKALLMGDQLTAVKIMHTPYNPKEYKRLGRQVKPFNPKLWDDNCKAIVKEGNYLKFEQNPALAEKLKATAGTTLVEASPFDKIWGIGLAADDPRAQYRNSWLGKNLLGEILTEVRKEMFGR